MSGPGKRYLGDGVYVEVDEERDMVKLTTSDGIRDTNTVYLEPEVVQALERWLAAARTGGAS